MIDLGSSTIGAVFVDSHAGIQGAGSAALVPTSWPEPLFILVMWALDEMAALTWTAAPSPSITKAYVPAAGATAGWLWWMQLVVVISTEALRSTRGPSS